MSFESVDSASPQLAATMLCSPSSADYDDELCGQIEFMTHDTFFSMLSPLLQSLAVAASPPPSREKTAPAGHGIGEEVEDCVRRGIHAGLQKWADASESNGSIFNGIVADVSHAFVQFVESYFIVPRSRWEALEKIAADIQELKNAARLPGEAATSGSRPGSGVPSGTKIVQSVVAGSRVSLRAPQEFLVEILPQQQQDDSINTVKAFNNSNVQGAVSPRGKPPISSTTPVMMLTQQQQAPPATPIAVDERSAADTHGTTPRTSNTHASDGIHELRKIEYRLRNERGESVFAPFQFTIDSKHDDTTRVDRREKPALVTSKDEKLLHQLDPARREYLHAVFGDPELKAKRHKEVLAKEMIKFARRSRGVHHVVARVKQQHEGIRPASAAPLHTQPLASGESAPLAQPAASTSLALFSSTNDDGAGVEENAVRRFVRPVSCNVAHGGLRNKFSSMFDPPPVLDALSQAAELELPLQHSAQILGSVQHAKSPNDDLHHHHHRWRGSEDLCDAFNPIRSRPSSAAAGVMLTEQPHPSSLVSSPQGKVRAASALLSTRQQQGHQPQRVLADNNKQPDDEAARDTAAKANCASFAEFVRMKRRVVDSPTSGPAHIPAPIGDGNSGVAANVTGQYSSSIALINANDHGLQQKLDHLVHMYRPAAHSILENAATMSIVSRPSSALAEIPAPSSTSLTGAVAAAEVPSSIPHQRALRGHKITNGRQQKVVQVTH